MPTIHPSGTARPSEEFVRTTPGPIPAREAQDQYATCPTCGVNQRTVEGESFVDALNALFIPTIGIQCRHPFSTRMLV